MPGATGQDSEGPRFDAALFVCGSDLIAGNERLRDLGCKKDRSLIGFLRLSDWSNGLLGKFGVGIALDACVRVRSGSG
ncbi:hypothetical protein [Herbaspirillum lusitanum]|uniref:hypothetical protein n=1 Tax=Herbaspirillum lusitanum TaxID=213312 RepID=UPI0022371363|nr:hypothetical protein [Herbaspirillum lusitanum]